MEPSIDSYRACPGLRTDEYGRRRSGRRDAGTTWSRTETSIEVAGATRFIPFGNVVEGFGLTAVAMYDCRMTDEEPESRQSSAHLFVSDDGAMTWAHRGVIGLDRYTDPFELLRSGGSAWEALGMLHPWLGHRLRMERRLQFDAA